MSLWVVLMVPVSAFAAVVAMAGPQRLGAESSMQEAADDLAMFTVAWRDGQTSEGPLPAFPPECAARTEQQQADLNTLDGDITRLDPDHVDFVRDRMALEERLMVLRDEFGLKSTPILDKGELRERFNDTRTLLNGWDDACEDLFEALLRDLGYLGIDMGSLRGSYSDSLKESTLAQSCTLPQHTTQAECTSESGIWNLAPHPVPCRTSSGTDAVVVRDAVHVALAADWGHAGWAAAQVWRDGLPMAAESIGRLSQYEQSAADPECGTQQLQVLDSQGRPVWADSPVQPPSRELVESVPRTALSN
ncbi:MAG: hypothetical protein OXC00_16975 [Acidimicrobiaceae bacterium]|nr:hypothetical protein [Acidimicrobiaceae bacterium]